MAKRSGKARAPLEKLPGLEEAKKFYFALQSWRDGAQIVLTAASSLCFTVAGISGLSDPKALFSFPAVFWPAGGLLFSGLLVWGRFRVFKPTYSDLLRSHAENSEEAESHRKALQSALDTLAIQMLEYVCKEAYDCRISAYSVEGNEFLLLSRYSRNPRLEIRGRAAYPLTEGNIGQAWAKGWALQDHDSTDRGEWEEALVASGLFAPETAASLTMQSQSIYSQRVDRGAEKVGMLVFECENPERFDEKTRKKVVASLILKAMADIIWESHVHFPRVLERKQELSSATSFIAPWEPEWKRSQVQADPEAQSGVDQSNVNASLD